MENLIDSSYFWGNIKMPYLNIQSAPTSPTGRAVAKESDELDRYITSYQREYLVTMFGSEIVPDQVATLVNDEVAKLSPIADYVFCKFMQDQYPQMTPSGVKGKTVDNAANYPISDKVNQAWNRMVRSNKNIAMKLLQLGVGFDYPIFKPNYYHTNDVAPLFETRWL